MRRLSPPFKWALAFLAVAWPPGAQASDSREAAAAVSCCIRDSDKDGLSDSLERQTGTRPFRADSDGDGVPDGVEDLDQDGKVDPGESNPRVSGLFPGRYPHIPEPMVFDLVRGLGARKDEVEVNALAIVRADNGHLEWAPEIEWAFARNFAAEIELPMNARKLEAIKLALQATLPQPQAEIAHGVQVIGEYLLSTHEAKAVAIYIMGGRIGGWSFLGMGGGRAIGPRWARSTHDLLLNPSAFYDVTERFTVGVENNLTFNRTGRHALTSIPQLHWQLSRRVRVQVGGGVSREGGRVHALASTRLILE